MLFLPSWPLCSAPRSTPPELPAAPDASGLVGCCSLKGNSMTRADPGLFISFQITGFCWIWLGCFCLTKISKMKNQWFDSTISAGGFFLTGLVPGIPRGWENEPPSQTSLSCWSFKHLTVRKKSEDEIQFTSKDAEVSILCIYIYIYIPRVIARDSIFSTMLINSCEKMLESCQISTFAQNVCISPCLPPQDILNLQSLKATWSESSTVTSTNQPIQAVSHNQNCPTCM